jgi:hypothetical protein
LNIELAITGASCAALAFGHGIIGLRWVLPSLSKSPLPPMGSRAMTVGMVRFTWHVVTAMTMAFCILFFALALAPEASAKTLLLGWFAAFWLAATARAFWNARRPLRSLGRPPVTLLDRAIAALSIDLPRRIQDLTRDFWLEDVWALPTSGGVQTVFTRWFV